MQLVKNDGSISLEFRNNSNNERNFHPYGSSEIENDNWIELCANGSWNESIQEKIRWKFYNLRIVKRALFHLYSKNYIFNLQIKSIYNANLILPDGTCFPISSGNLLCSTGLLPDSRSRSRRTRSWSSSIATGKREKAIQSLVYSKKFLI